MISPAIGMMVPEIREIPVNGLEGTETERCSKFASLFEAFMPGVPPSGEEPHITDDTPYSGNDEEPAEEAAVPCPVWFGSAGMNIKQDIAPKREFSPTEESSGKRAGKTWSDFTERTGIDRQSVQQAFTVILEGSEFPGSESIAGILSDNANAEDGTDDIPVEMIMARMPQIISRMSEQGVSRAAQDVALKLRTYLCPLENTGKEELEIQGMSKETEAGVSVFTEKTMQTAEPARESDGSVRRPLQLRQGSASQFALQGEHAEAFAKFSVQEHDGAVPAELRVKAEAAASGMERMIEAIRAGGSGGQQKFTVDLKPEYLGRLTITLTMDENGVRGIIRAADADIRELISGQVSKLLETLQDKGITVTRMDIAQFNDSGGDFMGRNGAGQGHGAGQPEYGRERRAWSRPADGETRYEAQFAAASGVSAGEHDYRI